ncbi:DUF4136 domain-containing protein [Flavobacterium sp. N3904]|uniref:DUF4136 domain-containing protein n=1 Tax=Flavobacterium sp. N3904 TaxID=2986835 RepID=UPI002224AB6A|nr:DUF4136 domain-containing protein [Flavobacterium sp. N3904]
MKTIIKTSLFLFLVSLFVSCSSVTVSSDYDHSANFSKYKTFSFYQLNVTGQTINQLNQNRIISDVKANLISKGFTEDTSNPDMLVNATTVMQAEKQYNANTNYYGAGGMYRPYGWGGGYGGMGGMANTTVSVQNYTDGSLVIDIIDASTKTLIWTGTGSKDIYSQSDNPDQAVLDAVTKIMASFPPGAPKQ